MRRECAALALFSCYEGKPARPVRAPVAIFQKQSGLGLGSTLQPVGSSQLPVVQTERLSHPSADRKPLRIMQLLITR